MLSFFSNLNYARVVVGLISFLVVGYAAVLCIVWWKQERLLFSPTVLPANFTFNHPADVKEIQIDVPGAKISALHLRMPKPKAVVFFLHGNSGSLENWFVNIDFYRQMNVDLVMIDYRGFGKSTGQIQNEAQLVNDAVLSWRSIAPQYSSIPVVFLGRSLGTGVAAQLNSLLPENQKAPLLILVSPYFSLEEIAKLHFWFVPSFLLRYPLKTNEFLSANKLDKRTSVVLIHGSKDSLIPLENSKRLAALSPDIRLSVINGAAHNDLQDFPDYLQAIQMSIDRIATTSNPKPTLVQLSD